MTNLSTTTMPGCVLLLVFLCSCQSVPEKNDVSVDTQSQTETDSESLITPGDPWEKLNRKTHGFNDVADRIVAKPVAKGYSKIVPGFIRTRFAKFFQNLSNINNLINNIFQGKIKAAASDTGRLIVNTTIGLGGLFDPATSMGMAQHAEDWGQTLATWGVGSGPYLVIPLLGPGTVRGSFGRMLDSVFDPLVWLRPESHQYGVYTLRLVHGRAELLPLENVMFGDKYIFFRDAYLQRREFMINDGEVEDPFADDF